MVVDNSQKVSFHAGESKGQAQTKADQMTDKARNAYESTKESCQEVHFMPRSSIGQQMQAKAQGAADAVKDAIGMNKWKVFAS